jgi:hypothetical protein
MAQSPAHQFGQMIGDLLEAAVWPILRDFASQYGLFLDRKGPRPCRRGKKCVWTDANGNSHDLDFVLERGGNAIRVGTPVAFVETAWRRYTKHSRNKVQEIQGAIEPLAATYRDVRPFKGAVLAGVFTEGALAQLRSLGFTVLFVPNEHVLEAFRQFGIDAASDERTSDREFQRKTTAFRRLSVSKRRRLCEKLIPATSPDVQAFIESLRIAVTRTVAAVIVTTLHGASCEMNTIESAIQFIDGYAFEGAPLPLLRFEVEIRYSNGDTIHGSFGDKTSTISFLNDCRPSRGI